MDNRLQMLSVSVHKLLKRGATANLKKVIEKTHEADLAEILSNLPSEERKDFFDVVKDKEIQATIVSYLDPNVQTELLESLEPKGIQQIVSHMETDDAADLLGHLPDQVADEILATMDKSDSEEVAGLMGYPEDSAGGLMSSEVLALFEGFTVKEAIQNIQNQEDDNVISFYIYVVNEAKQLVGVLSLKQLLLSRPSELLKDVMSRDVLKVSVDTHQEEVAQMVERYDFLAVPVVNSSNELVGVITVDDVIDVIREESEEERLALGRLGSFEDLSFFNQVRARIPWVFVSFSGGVASFGLFYLLASSFDQSFVGSVAWLFAGFLPLLLAMGATLGHQSLTIATELFRKDRGSQETLMRRLGKELQVGLLFSLIFGVLSSSVVALAIGPVPMALVLGLTLAVQIVFSALIGSLLPYSMRQISVDPMVVSTALLTAVIEISAICFLFAIHLGFAAIL